MVKLPAPFAVLKNLLNREKELGEFIAGPDEPGLRGWVQEKYRHRCRELSNVPGWARALGGFAFGSASRICEPYWDDNGWDAPTAAPPFTGGQCDAVYTVNFTLDVDNAGSTTGFCQARGPIRGIEEVESGTGAFIVNLLCSGVNLSGSPTCRAVANTGAGAYFVGGTGPAGGGGPRINSVSPCGADDCGDPPPERQPGPNPAPDPGPLPGPEPTDDPTDPTGPPLLPIPPFDDPLGGPLPIEAEPDPTDVAGPEDIPGNPDTAPGGGDDVGEPIAVDPGPEGGGEETDFGPPPPDRSWVGCILRFTFPSSIGAIAGSGPANPVSPRVVGNASLVYEGGRGDAFQVRSASMVIVRPTGALRVTGVYVNSEPGITYTIRPLSLKNCPDNACGVDE